LPSATLGKAFAECHTRQRPHGKILADKGVFAECYFLGTRQRLYRVLTLDKDKNKKIKKNPKKENFFCRRPAPRQPLPIGQVLEFFASLRPMGFGPWDS